MNGSVSVLRKENSFIIKENVLRDANVSCAYQLSTKMTKTMFPNVIRYGKLQVVVRNMGDVNTVFGVMFRNIYGSLELRKDDIVLDAGANIGTFSLLASRIAAHIYSVEPDRGNYLNLLSNLRLNHNTNVTPIEACLGSYNGIGYLTGENDATMLAGSFGRVVNVKTIDGLIEEVGAKSFDVVKMDIEGSEVSALHEQKFLSGVRELIAETHGFELERKTTSILNKCGFRVERISPPSLLMNHLKNMRCMVPYYVMENLRYRRNDIRTYVDYGLGVLGVRGLSSAIDCHLSLIHAFRRGD